MATTTMTMPMAAVAPSLGPSLVIGGAVLLGLNFFAIVLRGWTRATISKNFNYNDVFMFVAVAAYAGLLALVILGVQNGIGGHTSSATVPKIGNSLKYIFFIEIIYVILTSVMKASLAITLLQWAKKKFHVTLLWAAVGIDATICLVVVFYFLFQCQPISYAWRLIDPTVKGKCLPATGQILVGFALCGVTVSLDMIFLIVPFFMLKGRGVNSRLKLYIYGIFGLGVLASFANFIRLGTLVKLKNSTDPLFDAAPVFLWSAVEVSIGIMAAGIIELSPLMRKIGAKGFEDSFDRMEDDLQPINLKNMGMDKSNISFPMEREMDAQSIKGGRGMGMGGGRRY